MSVFSGSAQKVINLLGLTGLGQKNSVESLSVTIAADQPPVPVDASGLQFKGSLMSITGDDSDHLIGSETVVDIPLTDDTSIYSTSVHGNYGASDFFAVGRVAGGGLRRALVRADLSGLADLAISRASLFLYHQDLEGTTRDSTVVAHRILPGNSGWVEGTKASQDATDSDPSWAKKSQTPDIPWAGSVGLGTPDTDYAAAIAGSLYVKDGVTGWHELVLDTSEFRSLVAANNGLLLKEPSQSSDGAVAYFASSEAANAAKRPFFRVAYGETEQATRVLLLPSATGCTWSYDGEADTSDAPVPSGGIELPLMADGFPRLAVYVPVGVTLWVAKLGV